MVKAVDLHERLDPESSSILNGQQRLTCDYLIEIR
jgi:hypothetical protein